MTQVQRKRFIRYANFLNRLSSKHFNLDVVCSAGENPMLELLDKENSCGTVACAYGHLPIFNPRVFEYYTNGYRGRWGTHNVVTKGKHNFDEFEAATEYFGITREQATELFEPRKYMPSDWRNPKAVAAVAYKILGMKIPA